VWVWVIPPPPRNGNEKIVCLAERRGMDCMKNIITIVRRNVMIQITGFEIFLISVCGIRGKDEAGVKIRTMGGDGSCRT